jgi:hypothetical protein
VRREGGSGFFAAGPAAAAGALLGVAPALAEARRLAGVDGLEAEARRAALGVDGSGGGFGGGIVLCLLRGGWAG